MLFVLYVHACCKMLPHCLFWCLLLCFLLLLFVCIFVFFKILHTPQRNRKINSFVLSVTTEIFASVFPFQKLVLLLLVVRWLLLTSCYCSDISVVIVNSLMITSVLPFDKFVFLWIQTLLLLCYCLRNMC